MELWNEHPLGILCRCKEYNEVVDKLKIFQPGAHNPYLSRQPENSSMKVIWVPVKTEKDVNPTKAIINNYQIPEVTIDPDSIELKWISPDREILSLKNLRENLSYIHQGGPNSQSSEISVLTDMLPHRGRPVKRKDIDWSIGSHKSPVIMTDEPETNYGLVKACFSDWAEASKLSTGIHPY